MLPGSEPPSMRPSSFSLASPIMPVQDRVHRTWLHSQRPVPRIFISPVLRFMQLEAASGVLMLVAAVVAIVWANLPGGESYERFWETAVNLHIGGFALNETLRDVVNDALMAIFFFVVGLEIKRELAVGELRDPKAAGLPVFAALGGMIFPALIYLAFVNNLGPEATRGWGVPVATDIAFSIGILALVSKRVPLGAKLFLLTLAIADDIGGIIVIAIFYTTNLALKYLIGAIVLFALVKLAERAGIRSMGFYWAVGLVIWYFMLESGVHPTLTGVFLGLLTPATAMYTDRQYYEKTDFVLKAYGPEEDSRHSQARVDHSAREVAAIATESIPPLNRLEHALTPWSSFLVIPIFALANAGVRFTGVNILDELTSKVTLGVGLGLLVGKFVGVSLFTAIAIKLGIGKLPNNTTWHHIFGVALLAGVGFTVALFITTLAFRHPAFTDMAKTGIFAGSFLAGALGYTYLRFFTKPIETTSIDD
ncbi:MAG TPA: Na+/H+ antiporter NhaA [Actinobacteria bacterium]|nr:Na+/H+ antiporter NhaA [Actinomycetota bacterium]